MASEGHGAAPGPRLLSPGSEHPWPADCPAIALPEGELALIAVLRNPPEGPVLERRTLACVEGPCRLPPPPLLPEGVTLCWKVVRPARWEPVGEGSRVRDSLPAARLPDLAELLAALLAANGMKPPPGSNLDTIGEAVPTATPTPDPTPTPLLALAARLAARHGTSAAPLLDPPADPLDHLRALLEQADLIAVPLQIEAADLQRDCGDLILL
ncbi:MAG: hypothetical protein VKK43_00200, partial [Synechococcaceae cyanobacterium]|nr:hypothetical protein [Synechococcaceae cyanobacterium]